jgi:hypothetical protein
MIPDNDLRITVFGPAGETDHFSLSKLMNLIEAAERAELKLRTEYQALLDVEDLSHPMESWAEGEILRQALDDLRFDVLLNRITP